MGYATRPRHAVAAGSPPLCSAAIHFSELGTTLVSGISHHSSATLWRTVGVLAAPGFVASLPAHLLVNF